MSNKTIGMIRRVYGILLTISILIAAVCLMAACLEIYDGGNGTFSREAVAAAFSPIAAPVVLCLALVLLSFPLNLLPQEAGKRKTVRNNRLILQRLHSKADLGACDAVLRDAVAAQQKCRRLCRSVTLGLLAATFLIFMIYVLTGDRFLLPDITTSMKQAMLVLLPCLAVTFGYGIFAHYRSEKSILAEIDLMKQAVKEAPAEPEANAELEVKMNVNTLRTAITLVAVAVLLFGYFTGGTADVLTKAINICTECIGLG